MEALSSMIRCVSVYCHNMSLRAALKLLLTASPPPPQGAALLVEERETLQMDIDDRIHNLQESA